jgi:hypothetical protein
VIYRNAILPMNFLKNLYKKLLLRFVFPYLPHPNPSRSSLDSLIGKSARFIACEMIEGDYLEFGIYQGASFINSYYALKKQYEDRINLQIGGASEEKQQRLRQKLWNGMRFFCL